MTAGEDPNRWKQQFCIVCRQTTWHYDRRCSNRKFHDSATAYTVEGAPPPQVDTSVKAPVERPGVAADVAVEATKSAAKPSRKRRNKPSKAVDCVVQKMRATDRAELIKIVKRPESAAANFDCSVGTVRRALAKFLGLDHSDQCSRSFKAMWPLLK